MVARRRHRRQARQRYQHRSSGHAGVLSDGVHRRRLPFYGGLRPCPPFPAAEWARVSLADSPCQAHLSRVRDGMSSSDWFNFRVTAISLTEWHVSPLTNGGPDRRLRYEIGFLKCTPENTTDATSVPSHILPGQRRAEQILFPPSVGCNSHRHPSILEAQDSTSFLIHAVGDSLVVSVHFEAG